MPGLTHLNDTAGVSIAATDAAGLKAGHTDVGGRTIAWGVHG